MKNKKFPYWQSKISMIKQTPAQGLVQNKDVVSPVQELPLCK